MEGNVYHITNTRELRGVSGIYKISFKGSDNFYIGSSKDIDIRMRGHRSNMRCSTHRNQCLINAYNKYSLDNCYVEIMKCCEVSNLLEQEQHFIDTLNPEYNIAKNTTGGTSSKLSKEDILNIRFEYFNRSYIEDIQEIADKYDIKIGYLFSIATGLCFKNIKNPPELQDHINKNRRRVTTYRDKIVEKKYIPKPSMRDFTKEQVGMIRWAIANNKSITELYKHIGVKSSSRHLVTKLVRNETYIDYQDLVDASHLNLPPAQNIKVKMEDIPKIRWATQQGIPHGEIARVFGCSKDTSGGIKAGRYYSYIEGVEPCDHLFNK